MEGSMNELNKIRYLSIYSGLRQLYRIILIKIEEMEKQVMSKGANYKHSQLFGYKGPN
jgi:hypothetical protein